jgi:hypothetical protein
MKTKETSNQCRVCGGEPSLSTAFLNDLIAMEDFGGETTKTRGATLSRLGKTKQIHCLKCTNCGHSWIPQENKEEDYPIVDQLGNRGFVKPNQKQFKEFNEDLFRAYIDKFSDENKYEMLRLLAESFKLNFEFNNSFTSLWNHSLE